MRVSIEGEVPGLTVRIPTLWQIVREIRAAVLKQLGDFDADLRADTAMVASELVENVVKYGLGPGDDEPSVLIEVRENVVRVQTTNVASEERCREVLEVLARIDAHDDPEALYASVIERGLEAPTAGVSQQGFYRIAAVGRFALRAFVTGGCLEIIAERRIP